MVKPFIKWAGGKTKLLTKIPIIEKNTYIEPFLGGGSVLIFVLQNYHFKEYIANDSNETLIKTYMRIKTNVEELISELKTLTSETIDEKKYYELRSAYNNLKHPLYHSEALFIVLNKKCFRGLYRVSGMSGEFNTPFDTHNVNVTVYDPSNLRALSELFQNVKFYCLDYKEFLNNFDDDNCTIYMDPPYYGTFQGYTSCPIDYNEFTEIINSLNGNVIISNSREYYDTFHPNFNVIDISVQERMDHSGKNKSRNEVILF
jgi:DNA adenine methylase